MKMPLGLSEKVSVCTQPYLRALKTDTAAGKKLDLAFYVVLRDDEYFF